jgi:hypothetical protein
MIIPNVPKLWTWKDCSSWYQFVLSICLFFYLKCLCYARLDFFNPWRCVLLSLQGSWEWVLLLRGMLRPSMLCEFANLYCQPKKSLELVLQVLSAMTIFFLNFHVLWLCSCLQLFYLVTHFHHSILQLHSFCFSSCMRWILQVFGASCVQVFSARTIVPFHIVIYYHSGVVVTDWRLLILAF